VNPEPTACRSNSLLLSYRITLAEREKTHFHVKSFTYNEKRKKVITFNFPKGKIIQACVIWLQIFWCTNKDRLSKTVLINRPGQNCWACSKIVVTN